MAKAAFDLGIRAALGSMTVGLQTGSGFSSHCVYRTGMSVHFGYGLRSEEEASAQGMLSG